MKNYIKKNKSKFKLFMDSSQNIYERKKINKYQKKCKKILNCVELERLQYQLIRLKGQQKLLYLKQAIENKISDQQLFLSYPYCKLSIFVFNIKALQKTGTIVQDNNGLHWIESSSAYVDIKPQQTQTKYIINGWAISLFTNGKIIQGFYNNSQLCGLGYQLQPNGDTYIGHFKQGYKFGFGTYYWFNSGEVYSGNWLRGFPHGNGKYLTHNFYQGQFCNGIKYGKGRQYFINGDRYIGQYTNGIANGYGEYFWLDGSIYHGNFQHGVRHGYGIWHDQGSRQNYSGQYRLDKKNGFGVYQWVGKQYYQGEFREDFREGYGRLYQVYPKAVNNQPQVGRSAPMQKLVYDGMWQRGKKIPERALKKGSIQKLDSFLLDEKKIFQRKIKRYRRKNFSIKLG